MHFRYDQLGKNILRDFFGLVGAAETEVEVPAGDAQRIDGGTRGSGGWRCRGWSG
ncbi:hypothetical protein [Sorangium sp. So ce854]|uniref:hypothetical protein n=1 Tax=Sorangium sp. So ce854 TaxID=3133322 RepID=UPI003F5FB50B